MKAKSWEEQEASVIHEVFDNLTRETIMSETGWQGYDKVMAWMNAHPDFDRYEYFRVEEEE